MSAPKPLKSALKKSKTHSHPSSHSHTLQAGPSTSTSASGSKASIKLSVKRKESDDDEDGDVDMDDDEEEEEDEEDIGTDEEIDRAQNGTKDSSKKTTKRKRPTTASDFGATLTSLLSDPLTKSKSKSKSKSTTEVPTKKIKTSGSTVAPIMALSAHKPPTKAAVSLEAKARRQLKVEKEEKEDKARVIDVVEGWSATMDENGKQVVGGQEFEKGLRKVAQRGVIKLFNAILVASKNAEEAHTSLSAQAGLKPDLPKSRKEKDNILGRGGKEDVLTKESFLDLVRKGSTR